jgi:NADPH:quinone reductase-like Zn-dependent oxidoreductase
MRAWILNDTNGPSSYRLADVDTPTPGPGEVRVKLLRSALNHLDLWTSMGLPAPKSFPHVTGADGAGTVDAVGEGVEWVAAGDEVIINPSVGRGPVSEHIPYGGDLEIVGEHLWGTLAEQVVVPAGNVEPKPTELSWEDAAAFGLVTGTAYRMLKRARLEPGSLLLVVGVGGGVSSAGLSLGIALGAEVWVTSTKPAKIERAKELGAAGGFDSAGEFARELKVEAGRPADVVLENVGAATWNQSMRSLGSGGRLVTCGATAGSKVDITIPALFFKHHEIIGSTMFDRSDFTAVTEMVGRGDVDVHVDRVYAFEELPAALERLESGEQLGKIVISHE